MKKEGYYFKRVSIILLIFITVCGCSVPRKVVESISGNYMDGLEQTRANSQSQVFNYKIDECFEKVLTMLDKELIKVEILKVDIYNYSILVLVSRGPMSEDVDSIYDANTADVGIFFSEEGLEKTKIEISSLSTLFAEYTAENIFKELNKVNIKDQNAESK